MRYRVRWGKQGIGLLSCALLSMACTHVLPKQPPPVLNDTSPTLAPADTNDLQEGHIDFSRYDTPATCERAVLNIRATIWRRGERDTLRYNPEGDTLPTAAVVAGKQCAAKFTVENVDPAQLFYLARLSLALGDEAQAEAAIERRISLAPDAMAQATVLLESINTYLQATPVRFAAAQALLKKLDVLGNAARIARLQAHHAMLSYVAIPFDTAAMLREADSVIAISKTLPRAELDTFGNLLPAPFLHRAAIAAFRESPSAAIAIIQRGITEVGTIRGGQPRSTLRFILQAGYAIQARLYGQPAPPLVGHYWYNAGDSTMRPAPGKVSLLVQANHNCGEFCYYQYALIRRLYEQYRAAGLEITVVARTTGYSPNSGVQTPAEESESIRKYFMEDQKLPVALVVQESSFITREDGRRVNQPTQYDTSYNSSPVVIVDQAGRIRWLGRMDASQEAVINAYIVKLLAEE